MITNPVMPSVHGTFLWDAGPSKHQSEHLFFIGLFQHTRYDFLWQTKI